MVVHYHTRLAALRTVKAEWLVLCPVLLAGALMIAYFVWNERSLPIDATLERLRWQTLIIDESLGRRLNGVRSILDSTRDALRANSGCTADCRRLLLQSLKRAMPAVRLALCSLLPPAVIPGDRHLVR
jgi:hypothetical protein